MLAKRSPSVLLIARPGRDRRSLASLLRTLDGAQLFLLDGEADEACVVPDLVVVDLDGLKGGPDLLAWAARRWPKTPRLALSDDLRRTANPRSLKADIALARSAPVGDLLQAARRILI